MTPLHSRRVFLHRGMAMLAGAATVPMFLDKTVMAMVAPDDLRATQADSGTDGKILVIVQLSGGNDGLNTVVPWADDAYHTARPQIGKKASDVVKIDDYLGLNPNLAPFSDLMQAGEMSVIQGVGYPNPNRSHFRSMDIWHTAEPDSERNTSGWLGRYFDNTCCGSDPVSASTLNSPLKSMAAKPTATDIGPEAGISFGDAPVLAMKGERFDSLSFRDPNNFKYRGPAGQDYLKVNQPNTDTSAAAATPRPRAGVPTPVSEQEQLNFLARTALDAQASSDRILAAVNGHNPKNTYPNSGLARSLKMVAGMIRAGLPTRVYYVTLGGFDTHANQVGRHDNLMTELSGALSAFWADMKDQKNDERTLVMTFSEFGRRVQQNASNGTDHGAAAPMFLLGRRLQQTVIGRHPSLTDLDAGDLKYGIDFRSVYASLLQNWLDTPSKPILGKQFPTMPIVKG